MIAVASAAGRIGPNAITQVAGVLPLLVGAASTQALFDAADLAGYLLQPPEAMVDEREVTRLHAVLRAELGARLAGVVAREAGLRTAQYLLAHRIPKAVQVLLKLLPASWAARLLLAAIRRHAWTFAGSGIFTARAGCPVVLAIRDNPLCRNMVADAPVCDFYAATFQHLFAVLVHRRARVVETACEASGGPECRFEVRW